MTSPQIVEVRPGFVGRSSTGKVIARPLLTKVLSLRQEQTKLTHAVRGGLVGVGTTLDPSCSGKDKLVGQVVGTVGTLPSVYSTLYMVPVMLRRQPKPDDSTSSRRSKTKREPRLRVDEVVRLHVNASTITAHVTKLDKATGGCGAGRAVVTRRGVLYSWLGEWCARSGSIPPYASCMPRRWAAGGD